MSLERSEKFFNFLYKRWLRIFPAMLAVSLLCYIFKDFFPYRPEGVPNLIDLIPGLTFLHAEGYNLIFKLLNIDVIIKNLDGVFWSLYV